MTQKQALQIFEERKVRTVWDDEQEKWYFAIQFMKIYVCF